MKKLFLFIILLFFSLRPIFFLGQVLYYEFNVDYIVETYCINKDKPALQCNGKCHLAKQLQLTSPETNNDSKSQSVNLMMESFFPVFFQTSEALLFTVSSLKDLKENSFYYENLHTYSIDQNILNPSIV